MRYQRAARRRAQPTGNRRKRLAVWFIGILMVLLLAARLLLSDSDGAAEANKTSEQTVPLSTSTPEQTAARDEIRAENPSTSHPLTPKRFFVDFQSEPRSAYESDSIRVHLDDGADYLFVTTGQHTVAYPHIQFRDRIKSTVDVTGGSQHSRFDTMYPPTESFSMPAWATLPERETLDHASIFVSIAAYRDEECATTLLSILQNAKSPHRIYAGISEERLVDDVDCLSMLGLETPEAARRLLWGEEASTSSLYYKMQYMTWGDVLNGRRVVTVATAFKGTTRPPAPASTSTSTTAAPTSACPLHSSTDASDTLSDDANATCLCNTSTSSHEDTGASDGSSSSSSSTTVTTAPTKDDGRVMYMDATYKRDELSCLQGSVETARDEFLLFLHHQLPATHKRYAQLKAYFAGLPEETKAMYRLKFPLRSGQGLQGQLSPALAGCRVTTRVTSPSNARGPTFGRYVTSLLQFNQDYYMVIDSHSRFSLHWDSKMILRVFQLPTRGVLSHYPNGYVPEAPEGEFGKRDVMTMCKGVILDNGMPKLGANWMDFSPHPTLEAFAAAGYIFGDAQVVLDTPFDPFLPYLFDGEEILFSVRMWTKGWDIYCPGEANVFHHYLRPHAPKFWSLMSPERTSVQKMSERRALHLLRRAQPWEEDKKKYRGAYLPPSQRLIVTKKELTRIPQLSLEEELYGMGTNRSLDAFWEFTQLNDDYVKKKDNENRWEGGQHLCPHH